MTRAFMRPRIGVAAVAIALAAVTLALGRRIAPQAQSAGSGFPTLNAAANEGLVELVSAANPPLESAASFSAARTAASTADRDYDQVKHKDMEAVALAQVDNHRETKAVDIQRKFMDSFDVSQLVDAGRTRTPLNEALVEEFRDLLDWHPNSSILDERMRTSSVPGFTRTGPLQQIWDGGGDVSFDYFGVKASCSKSQESIFSAMRTKWQQWGGLFENSIRPRVLSTGGIERANPLGAVLELDMLVPAPLPMGIAITDWNDGRYWRVTTGAWKIQHPVSGHRDFGVKTNDDETVEIYTRAVDTCSMVINAGGLLCKATRFGQDQSWVEYQKNAKRLLEDNGCTNAVILEQQGGKYETYAVKRMLGEKNLMSCWEMEISEAPFYCLGGARAWETACAAHCVDGWCATDLIPFSCVHTCLGNVHTASKVDETTGRCVPA